MLGRSEVDEDWYENWKKQVRMSKDRTRASWMLKIDNNFSSWPAKTEKADCGKRGSFSLLFQPNPMDTRNGSQGNSN